MDSMDLDTKIAQASATLEKLAEENGVDLNKLSSDEIADLLGDIMGLDTSTETVDAQPEASPAEETEGKQASDEGAPQLTVADVGLALQKVAAAEGVDLSQLSPEQYAEAFNNVAAYLQSPQAEQDKVAAEELNTKLAEADLAGRQFARSFWDELKIASEEEEEEKDEEKEKKAAVADKVKSLFSKAKDLESRASQAIGHKLRGGDKRLAKRVSDKVVSDTTHLRGNVPEGVEQDLRSRALQAEARKSRIVGRSVAGGTAAAGTATAIAVPTSISAHKRRKAREAAEAEPAKAASVDELDLLVTDRARQLLVSEGVNPDSGEKFASDQEIIDFLAMEKLRAAGYEV